MKTLKLLLPLVLLLAACETQEPPVVPPAEASARYPVPPPSDVYNYNQPQVSVGVGFGSGGGGAYGGVGIHQGPFSIFLGI